MGGTLGTMRGFVRSACVAMPTLFAVSAFAQSPIDYVNPFVGTDGHGHTFPGPQVPFGMVQLSPDTRTDTWDGCSGYHYSDKRILGFSHTHLSGTGVGCLGDILVMPTLASEPAPKNLSSAFSHAQESAKPGYYRVFLRDPKVTAELTTTARAGLHRYTFPKSDTAKIAVDLVHGVQNDIRRSTLNVEGPATISGSRTSGGWGGERTVYFVMEFSKPFKSFTVDRGNGELSSDAQSSGKLRGFAAFDTKTGEQILVRVGISSTGIEGARKNLHAEMPDWRFERVQKAAAAQWNAALGTLRVESPDKKLLRTFYSNAYLSYLAPSLFNDVDGSYWGMDHKVHSGAKFQNYTTFSLWDTYRALHPLLTLTQPARVKDLTHSLLAEYQESGLNNTPVWPLCGNETWCMIGNHSIPVMVDAYFKGLLGPNAEAAYQAMRVTSMQDRNGLDTYKKLGYVASRRGAEASSRTIEYSVDDWCLATMAEALGHRDDAELFYRRSANYRNLWDKTTQFFRGRKADGRWRAPFDTLGLVGDEYTEANAWPYLFGVQHDVPGMISLQGGDAGFVKRLDQMFTMSSEVHANIPDITGLIGQYAQGNEQCHHTVYLYNFAGAPYKAQARVRHAMAEFFDDTPTGQIGNNDCGQMSAWYVFSAAGLYPVNPANGVYVLGSPAVNKATLQVGKGKTFTIAAEGNSPKNVYVQSVNLNGKPYAKSWISHADIMKGGTLRLVMGPKPNLKWGSAVAARPPRTMPKGFSYGPLPAPFVPSSVSLEVPIRVICGEDDPVEGFVPDPNMVEGSTNGSNDRVDLSGVENPAPMRVYQGERYGSDFSYRFSVPAGKTYVVRLHFAELFDSEIGERVENISVNGKLLLANFDILKEAGGMRKAVVREFRGVAPIGGKLVIRIQAAKNSPDQNAKISGIEVLPE